MNLDPTVPPWIGIAAATGVCCWMAAIGAPLAHAVFGDRPRPVWPFYAPALGIVAVLLTTNLSAYVIPGAPSAWFGLLAPSALAAAIAWRGGAFRRSIPPSVFVLLASLSAAGFVLAFSSRTQRPFIDEAWHFALARILANGVFPPATPYGPDAGIGYHYGHNLLAAVIGNTAGAPPWTSLFVLVSFLVVALMLAAAGLSWDFGASLPMAGGIGAAVGFFSGGVKVGLPPYVASYEPASGFAGFWAGLAPAGPELAFRWLELPQQALAIAIVMLIAAAFQVGSARSWVAIAAASGVSALADASVMLFAGAALGTVGAVRLVVVRRLGSERFAIGGSLVAAVLLIALAGGPISDALFGRGGTADMVRIAFDPQPENFLPAAISGPLWVRVGIVSLVAISALAAFAKRAWGLAYLTVAATCGLIEAQLLQSALEFNDGRILWLATSVAMFAALAGSAALIQGLRGYRHAFAVLAFVLVVLLPNSLSSAVASVQLASRGFQADQLASDGVAPRFVGDLHMRPELVENWDFYAWLGQFMPAGARLLTTHPGLSASVAGIVSPTSGRDLQMLSANVLPVYADAVRFLQRDDLAAMEITHLHVTDRLEEALSPPARRLLDNPAHFRLLADRHSVSGQRHRLYAVASGAGTRDVAPSSYRSLREVVPADAPVVLLGRLSVYQRRMILFTFVNRDNLWRTDVVNLDRATRLPRAALLRSQVPNRSVVIVADRMEPTALGLSRDAAIWAGEGMRAYDLTRSWSPVWRIPRDEFEHPQQQRAGCDVGADDPLDLQLLGEPGSTVRAGGVELKLTGTPQRWRVTGSICEQLALSDAGGVTPFAQARPYRPERQPQRTPDVAGLGFDGGQDNGRAIINLWYRNPHSLSFVTGSEFRIYEADQTGVAPVHLSPRNSIRWWSGPLVPAAQTQMAQVEFDGYRLEIDGKAGSGEKGGLQPGRTYLLALNIAGADPDSGYADVLQQIPLVRVLVGKAGIAYEPLSGILAIENRKPGARLRRLPSWGSISRDVDFTPAPEMAGSSLGQR